MMDYQRGQILLIVVLIMVTALTVGLAVAVRSISNTRISQDASDSEKAFSAAEAGIEQSLATDTTANGTFSENKAQYQTTYVSVGGQAFALNNGEPVLKDGSADLWLSHYPGYTSPRTGNITIYWGKATDICDPSESRNTMAALELIVFSGTTANPQLTRYAVDPCASRVSNNKFQAVSPGGNVAGKTYQFSKTIFVTSGLFVRIIPLYAPTNIGVTGCDNTNANCTALPVQGTVIQSVGTSGDTTRKIETYRYYPQLPAEILQYSFFVQQ